MFVAVPSGDVHEERASVARSVLTACREDRAGSFSCTHPRIPGHNGKDRPHTATQDVPDLQG